MCLDLSRLPLLNIFCLPVAVADPGRGSLILKHFKSFETEILTTEGFHMTINWLILNNGTCVAPRRSTKFQNHDYWHLYFFFRLPYNGWLRLESSRARRLQKQLLSAIWRRLSLYNLVLSTG